MSVVDLMDRHRFKKGIKMGKNEPEIMSTTLWDFPSRHYGNGMQGDDAFEGATPAGIIWNLLMRYTRKNDLVIDPMCGSGTTLDVARDLKRRCLGYDINPTRKDIFRVDARKLPLENAKVDFIFIDPPYSDHIKYSNHPKNIGNLSAYGDDYFDAMRKVIGECNRILKNGRCMALYVSDTFKNKKGFLPIGFRLFDILTKHFRPLDIVAIVRHNKKLKRHHWHDEAIKGNFFLRGFNYLFIMKKD